MNVTAIRRYTETPGEHVGDLLWWALEGARISRQDLEQIWSDAGLSTELLPEPPTAERALKTATREALFGISDHLFRLGKETEDELVFALLHEERDDAGNVHHSQVARVRLDRNHPARLESDSPSHDLIQAVFAGYDLLRHTHLVDDVRRALVRLLDTCAAVTLRDHGGVYWVPAQFSDTVHRLQGAVSRIGTSRLDILPIHATAEATAALGHAAHASIEAEITLLQKEIADFVAAPPERPATLVRRLEQFQDLKEKAGLYQAVLSVQVSDLTSSIDELTASVQRLLGGAQQAPDAVATPAP